MYTLISNYYYFFKINHFATVSQANLCNMTFTAGSLFPSHSCIEIRVNPSLVFELGCPT